MHNNCIGYFLLVSVEKGLYDVATHFHLRCGWKIGNCMQERFKCEDITDVLCGLENWSEKTTECIEDGWVEIFYVLEENAESFKDLRVESIFLISWEVFEDYCWKRSQQIQKNLNVIDLAYISPCKDHEFSTLGKMHSTEPLEKNFVNWIFIFPLSFLEHFDNVKGVCN